MFDSIFFKFTDFYKTKYKTKAIKIATFYITFLQITLLLVLGVFFSKFFSQFHIEMMSQSKAWTLFVIASIIIYFKNWMQYTGRKLTVKKANKMSSNSVSAQNIWTLWLLPFACIALAFVLLNAF
jgi:hypothetical protein